jgi:hypothetical protein
MEQLINFDIDQVSSPPQPPQNLTSILKRLEQEGLNDLTSYNLVRYIQHMNEMPANEDDREKLWSYVQRNFESACKNFNSRAPQKVEHHIEVLSLIVSQYTAEDFSVMLLNKVFLLLEDVRIFNDLELNILLMSKGIISISEWDR